ncbi:methyl-accepting chemotaxis protein [Derxia gummosa]|uniref:Methyl-accepting chemotaxis protein n=1 Tax=Derxia gummosa DSM 723 TaxID=1121388 RepID=A0A8B6X7X2_9BURK|nr:methyl-accepting chemotaxis protein [Derxia gummosa]
MNRLLPLTVRQQLLLSFGSLCAACLLIAMLGILALSDANQRFFIYINGFGERVATVSQLGNSTKDMAIATRNALLAGDTATRDRQLAHARDASARSDALLAHYNELVASATDMDDQARATAARLNQIEREYRDVALRLLAHVTAGERDAALGVITRECMPLLDSLDTVLADYVALSTRIQRERGDSALASLTRQRALLMTVSALALVGSLLLGIWLVRSLGGALGAEPALLRAVVGRVADGDLRPIPEAARAPAGSVLASLGAMQMALVTLIGRVGTAADSIATASGQIASGNQDLSRRTEQQASALQQTTAQMHQMTDTVRASTDGAHQASQLATEAARVANEGGAVMERVVGTMDEITESSRRIADIIGVIDGIAFQTNILALNAAVEAARAGDQGRGFAVVAQEVRSLASRSASAAREIKQLIDDSTQRVEAGSQLAGEAGTTIASVVRQVNLMSDLIADIHAAASEQASGIVQVNQAVGSLDGATQQNAALVEQSAAAADSLRVQAESMAALVGRFRLAG